MTESPDAKATSQNLPKSAWARWCKDSPASVMPLASNKPEDSPQSREVVRWFLSALATSPAKPPPLSKDLESLSRVVGSVKRAVADDILTEEEAEAVIYYMGECFARRRFDEVFSRITQPRSGAWFVVQSQSLEE